LVAGFCPKDLPVAQIIIYFALLRGTAVPTLPGSYAYG